MKLLHLILTTLLIFSCTLLAQVPDTAWTKTFGGPGWNFGFSVCQTNDYGYLAAGAKNFPSHDVWLIKTDADGDTMWTKTYGDTGQEGANSVQQTTDGGFIVAGGRQIPNGFTTWLLKTDSFGDTIWTCTYDTVDRQITNDEDKEISSAVQQTFDGGFIITGPSRWDNNTGFDFLLIKTDSAGAVEWRRTFGGDSTEISTFVQQTSDSGYIISGWTSEPAVEAAFLIRTNSNGDSLWSATFSYEVSNLDEIFSVKETSDGGFILAGTARPNIPDTRRVWLIKIDSQGIVEWEKIYGSGELTGSRDVIEIPGEGYVIAAHLSKGDEMYEGWLIRTDTAGDTLWTSLLESNYRNMFTSLEQTNDGGFITTGYYQTTDDSNMDVDLLLAKFNSDVTEIPLNNNIIPEQLSLEQNYPNPFNPLTNIRFGLPKASKVNIEVYNTLGQRVAELINKQKPAGYHTMQFDGTNLASGVYFYKIQAGKFLQVKKMLLLR